MNKQIETEVLAPLEIVVLQGPPAAGKSTYARALVEGSKKYIIVSRDEIRAARGDYWIPEQEDYISDVEEFQVRAAIENNLCPVIDATNLNSSTLDKWNQIGKELNVPIRIESFYLPFKEALKRDQERGKTGGRAVGESVLKRFYLRYFPDRYAEEEWTDHTKILEQNTNLPKAVIVDLDGTVALHQGRDPFNWEKIYTDKVDPRMQKLLYILQSSFVHIIFLTGRNKTPTAYEQTYLWLEKNFPYKWSLLMADATDNRKSNITKKELYDTYIKDKFNVICVFDDAHKVVNMWREEGLLTCQVANNDY